MAKLAMLATGLVLIVVLALIVQTRSAGLAGLDSQGSNSATDTSKIFAPGRVEGMTPEVELRPQIHGRVAKRLVVEGQNVRAGRVLLKLDDDVYQQEVAFALSDLQLAEAERQRLQNGAGPEERAEVESLYRAKLAQLDQAKRTWSRTDKLLEEGAVTQQVADDQLARVETLTAEVLAAKARVDLLNAPVRADELRIASAKVDAARARWELARTRLEKTELRAPINGQVLKIDVQLGELAGPDAPTPSLVLADTSRFQVRAFVEELDAPRLRVGMPALVVTDGLPDKQFKGCIKQISPLMGQKTLWSNRPAERLDTRTREVLIELTDSAQLVIGLRVDVTLDATGDRKASGHDDLRTLPAVKQSE